MPVTIEGRRNERYFLWGSEWKVEDDVPGIDQDGSMCNGPVTGTFPETVKIINFFRKIDI